MESKENIDNRKERIFGLENPEEESAQVKNAVEELEEEGKVQVAEIKEKGTPSEAEEMIEAAEEAEAGAEKAKDAYIEDNEEEKKKKLEILEKSFEKNKAKIKEVTEKLYHKLGETIDSEAVGDAVVSELAGFLKDEEFLKELEEEGVITEDMYRAAVTLSPVIENVVRTIEEEGGEDVSAMEKAKRVIIEILASTDPEKDPERIAAAGKMLILLSESGKISDKRACIVLKAAGMALQYEIVQNKISKEFRQWLEKERQEGKDDEEIAEELIKEAGY